MTVPRWDIRKITKERYDRAIADFAADGWGELTPDDGENRLTCCNRLKAAAERRGLAVTFFRNRVEAMRFKVGQSDGRPKAKTKPIRREHDI